MFSIEDRVKLETELNDMKSQTISNIGSGFCIAFHTIIVLLFIFSLRLILRVPLEGFLKTGRFLLALNTFMLGLSTLALISTLMLNFAYPTGILATYQADYEYAYPTWGIPTRKLSQLYISVSIWAADRFMIWRCTILYQEVSKRWRIAVLSSCFAMIMLSLAAGLVYVISNIGYTTLTFILFSSTTVAINVTITSLIVGRLLYHHNSLEQALGPKRHSPYLKIVLLLIESASLVVAFNIAVMLILTTRPDEDYYILILVQLTVHIYIIALLIIIFKVAYDRIYRSNGTVQTRDAQEVVD